MPQIPEMTQEELDAVHAEREALLHHVAQLPASDQDTVHGLKDTILAAVRIRGAIGEAALHLALAEHQDEHRGFTPEPLNNQG